MKSAKQLHETLDRIIDGLESGHIKIPIACEMNNAIGKKVALLKVELEYNAQIKKFGEGTRKVEMLEAAPVETTGDVS